MLKKFSVWLTRSMIIFVLATLIFSSVNFNFTNLVQNVFSDIYEYSSPEAQRQAIGSLTEACSALDRGQSIVTFAQLCTNETLIQNMRKNCDDFRSLKKKGGSTDNEQEFIETCNALESGEIEDKCGEIESSRSLLPDLSSIGVLCKEYGSGTIKEKEFFFKVVTSPFSSEQSEMPKIGIVDDYESLVSYLNSNKLLYFLLLLILGSALYFFTKNTNSFFFELGEICFGLGMLIMVPYFAIMLYSKFVGFDTSFILGNMFGLGTIFDPRAIISVLLLMFLRTYNSTIITIGVLLLITGIVSKTRYNKQKNELEIKPIEKEPGKKKKS